MMQSNSSPSLSGWNGLVSLHHTLGNGNLAWENPSTRDKENPWKPNEYKSSGASDSHSSKNPTFIMLVYKFIVLLCPWWISLSLQRKTPRRILFHQNCRVLLLPILNPDLLSNQLREVCIHRYRFQITSEHTIHGEDTRPRPPEGGQGQCGCVFSLSWRVRSWYFCSKLMPLSMNS